MENHVSLKVRSDIRKALKIKSANEDLNLRDITDKMIAKLF